MKTVNIGILGCGTVGSGVLKTLAANGGWIEKRENLKIHVKRILVNDLAKERPEGYPKSIFTDDPEEVLGDSGIDIIVEMLSGENPAADYILRAIASGKPVVTSNKSVVAARWNDIMTASRGGRHVFFDASVCGGIPIISILSNSMQANRINRVLGIINGTTNYILTRMSKDGAQFGDALAQAKRLGFAEADATADVEGFDAASKLSIIASLVAGRHVPVGSIYREGISKIDEVDISIGKELGFTLKMLAIAAIRDDAVEARVHPAFIPSKHPLASVSDSFNAVFIDGNAVGELMLYGRGAGDLPTASSVISDIITAAKTIGADTPGVINTTEETVAAGDWESEYYIRMTVPDRPGVLSKIAGVFSEHRISISSLIQKGFDTPHVPLVFVTHPCSKNAMLDALAKIADSPEVVSVDNLIHVVR
jgi:homoserine dehydrogenase